MQRIAPEIADQRAYEDSNHEPPLEHPLLAPSNLLLDFGSMAALLRAELVKGHHLDAFLLAAGLNQIAEDYLHRSFLNGDRLATTLATRHTRYAKVLSRGVRRIHDSVQASSVWVGADRGVLKWQTRFATVVYDLALLVARSTIKPANSHGQIDRQLVGYADQLLSSRQRLAKGLTTSVVRLPTCFRNLDQRPEDCLTLVDRLLLDVDLETPLNVIGLRTSGSYLAPLCAAYLHLRGARDARWATARPGQTLFSKDLAWIEDGKRREAIFLLVDDPPRSGASLGALAAQLERLGVDTGSIVLLLPLLGSSDVIPSRLQRYRQVILPWEEWVIHRDLVTTEVRSALATVLAASGGTPGPGYRPPFSGWSVEAVNRVGGGPAHAPNRDHAREQFLVALREPRTGARMTSDLWVTGVGLGYFGRHARTVALSLNGWGRDFCDVSNGLMFQLRGRRRAALHAWNRVLASEIARYVDARRRLLPADSDMSLRLQSRGAVWQRWSDLLGAGFGRARLLARPSLRRAAKRLLHVDQPSIVDGAMALENWAAEPNGTVVKDRVAEGAFSSQDLFSYDAVFDVAAAASEMWIEQRDEAPQLAAAMRSEYEALSGARIEDERWFAHLMVNLLHGRARQINRLQDGPSTDIAVRIDAATRALSSVHLAYLAQRVMPDADIPNHGGLCAIDIDGVLETGAPGYTASTPAGLMALRALTLHGYRPVLVSGRSVDEVRERCRALNIAGGVAEYGGWVYETQTDRQTRLTTDRQQQDLTRLNEHLQKALVGGQVEVDPLYSACVRVFVRGPDGGRRALPRALADSALRQAGVEGFLAPIHGIAQTDFVATGIDKGRGVRALAAALGAEDADMPLEMAIGDTGTDLPMLQLAKHAWAPANAEAVVRLSAQVARHSCQRGLEDAVAHLIGHKPGSCAACQAPRLDRNAMVVMTAFSARDRAGFMKAWTAAWLMRFAA